MQYRDTLFAGAAAILAIFPSVNGAKASTNLVQNPGFETGDFTDWFASNFFLVYTLFSHSGSHSAGTGCVGSTCVTTPIAYFGQNLNTTAGDKYALSFWVFNSAAGPGSDQEFNVFWNDSSLGATNYDVADTWTKITYTGLAATGTTTKLMVAGRNDPATIFFDDFSVTQGTGVPEPGTWAVMSLGFLGVGAVLRARKSLATALTAR